MTSAVIGAAELHKALTDLADFTTAEWKTALRGAVRKPMNQVMRRARANIAKISPGKTLIHKTYRGRQVGAGFASRNLRMVVKLGRNGTARAILGVRAEAFYALQFFEKGTAYIPQQPWLVPALEASKDGAVQEVGAAMKKTIDAIARRRAGAGATRNLI